MGDCHGEESWPFLHHFRGVTLTWQVLMLETEENKIGAGVGGQLLMIPGIAGGQPLRQVPWRGQQGIKKGSGAGREVSEVTSKVPSEFLGLVLLGLPAPPLASHSPGSWRPVWAWTNPLTSLSVCLG